MKVSSSRSSRSPQVDASAEGYGFPEDGEEVEKIYAVWKELVGVQTDYSHVISAERPAMLKTMQARETRLAKRTRFPD